MIISMISISGCLLYSKCGEKEKKGSALSSSEVFDPQMAAQLGADDYGMRQYVMAFLKAGPNRDQDSATAANLQRAHLDNITRLAEEGKLVVAGPFMDDFEVRGIYLFAVESLEEARALTATDPAIQSGRLEMELHPWYGSAAIMKINEIHEKIAKKGI
jgi:uncharacterized protein YciI